MSEVIVPSHNILSTHIPLVPCQSTLPFLGYSMFKVWPWKSKVKVIAQCHSVGLTSYRLISLSFHVDIGPSIPGIQLFQNLKLKIRSMSIMHPIIELWLFHNLTLKIKGQGRGWRHSSKSQRGSNILSTHIHFVPRQPGIPFLSYDFFKIWPWKSTVKVMGEVKVQSHNVGLTSYRLTSFSLHVNRPSHSRDTAFTKYDLEN